MPPPAASCRISRERFKRGSRNFTSISGTYGPTNLPDMTLLASCSRLQKVIIYCTKVRKTGAGGKESNSSAIVQRRIIKFTRTADLVYRNTGYEVINPSSRYFSKFEKKTVESAASFGFGLNFSGAALCLPHQLVGFLLLCYCFYGVFNFQP